MLPAVEANQLIAGRYRLLRELGRGSNGVVWLAMDETLERLVAVKRAFDRDTPSGSARIKRLRREVAILAGLNHPNIVVLYDVAEQDEGDVLLIMEYVELGSLDTHGKQSPLRTAEIGARLADALDAVHTKGKLHKDVKPGNVLVSAGGQVKLSDFGNAGEARPDATVTSGILVHGTPGYQAPEVADGGKPTAASDVFALGATLFTLVEGATPYGSTATEKPMALVRRAMARSIATPRQAGPLTPVLTTLLAPDAKDRPTAEQARRLLDCVAAGRPLDPDPESPDPMPQPLESDPEARPRRRRLIWWAASVSGVLVIALVVWLISLPLPGSPTDPIGDQHTADPCSLLDASAFGRFGVTQLDRYYGGFARCDVVINPGPGQVDVKVELDNTPSPAGQVQNQHGVTVMTNPASGGQCDRSLSLGDNSIDVTAKVDIGNGPANLCEAADVATEAAARKVAAGQIPRRTVLFEPKSLFNVNACGLLDNTALSQFPGVNALNPQPDFGDWGCTWQSTTDPEKLTLRFDQGDPPNASDGQPLQVAGHAAINEGSDYGDKSCEIVVIARQFRDDQDALKDEMLLVIVSGDSPFDQMCAQAQALAVPAAAKLPK